MVFSMMIAHGSESHGVQRLNRVLKVSPYARRLFLDVDEGGAPSSSFAQD